MATIPLHLNVPADPAWGRAVVGRIDFHTAIQVHGALAVLVIAEWLDRQRLQRRPLFSEHGGHLAFGSAVDARVGPVGFPVIQVVLRLLQAFKPASLSAVCFWYDRRLFLPSLCDPDRGRGRAARRLGNAGACRDTEDSRWDHRCLAGAPPRAGCRAPRHGSPRPAGGRPSGAVRPTSASWSGTPAGEPTCGCSRASTRISVCAGTCRCAPRGPWDHCRNRPGVLRPARSRLPRRPPATASHGTYE